MTKAEQFEIDQQALGIFDPNSERAKRFCWSEGDIELVKAPAKDDVEPTS